MSLAYDQDRVEIGYSVLVRFRYNYWPGYLVDFLPGQNAGEKNLYKVYTHSDRKICLKSRRDVIFMSDEKIAECSVGSAR